MGAREPEILVENLRKTFGGLIALDDVSMEIETSKVTLIIGPNGSGKSTLLNIIAGLLRPDRGRVYFRNIDITSLPAHERNKLGLVMAFQIPRAFQSLTVLENLLLAANGNPGERAFLAPCRRRWVEREVELVERAYGILRDLGLDALWDRKASELSGGQMKLLEVGRVMMNGARTVLMDEPIAGVLPSLARDVLGRIKGLAEKRGMTFVIVEHRLDLALGYADYVYAMSRGKVVSKGLPEQVVNDPLVQESYLQGQTA